MATFSTVIGVSSSNLNISFISDEIGKAFNIGFTKRRRLLKKIFYHYPKNSKLCYVQAHKHYAMSVGFFQYLSVKNKLYSADKVYAYNLNQAHARRIKS